jgi:hypothetical protein
LPAWFAAMRGLVSWPGNVVVNFVAMTMESRFLRDASHSPIQVSDSSFW